MATGLQLHLLSYGGQGGASQRIAGVFVWRFVGSSKWKNKPPLCGLQLLLYYYYLEPYL